MLLALLAIVGRLFHLGQFRQVPAGFFLDDLGQRNVRRAHARDVGEQRTAEAAAARVELAHAPRDEVDQNVGVANLLQCFFTKFSVQDFSQLIVEPVRIVRPRSEATSKSRK